MTENKRDKFLVEIIGRKYPQMKYPEAEKLDFSTWEGFGVLKEFIDAQFWAAGFWHEFLNHDCPSSFGFSPVDSLMIAADINPDTLADCLVNCYETKPQWMIK